MRWIPRGSGSGWWSCIARCRTELLGLAERPGDLTEIAQGVLRSEMGSRRLQVDAEPAAEAGHMGMAERVAAGADYYAGLGFPAVAQREPEMKPEPVAQGLAKGMVVLTTFHDAIAAGEAIDYLEAEEMEIEVRDVAAAQGGGGSFYGGPPVALQVIVQQRDLRRGMQILREKMGLFPVQEVEEADEAIDDGTTAVLGAFGHRSDAGMWRECWRRRGYGTASRPMRRGAWRMKTLTR